MLPGLTQSLVDIVISTRTENCRKRQADYRPVRSDIICFKCGKQGHRQFSCLNSSKKGPQKTAAMQLIIEDLNHDDQSMYSDSRPHNCDESQGNVKSC